MGINDGNSGMNILLADDDYCLRETLADFLAMLGHRITSACHGKEALAHFRLNSQFIDLLITDIRMPHLNGIELTEQVRQLNPSLPVIMITGHAHREQILNAMQMDIHLIDKPIDMPSLEMHLQEIEQNLK